ncbi:hypothetical protein DFR24_3176 [Panacagrimonas perspica]|uniref:Uncharacterized protein n=1 Tax=Panacagrimonas perspica TaxID=381431 RepID=A0A4V6Q4A5_9GAMM|nr:hypothetical protein DFR24_3176 [Panacagrimonas perspica]
MRAKHRPWRPQQAKSLRALSPARMVPARPADRRRSSARARAAEPRTPLRTRSVRPRRVCRRARSWQQAQRQPDAVQIRPHRLPLPAAARGVDRQPQLQRAGVLEPLSGGPGADRDERGFHLACRLEATIPVQGAIGMMYPHLETALFAIDRHADRSCKSPAQPSRDAASHPNPHDALQSAAVKMKVTQQRLQGLEVRSEPAADGAAIFAGGHWVGGVEQKTLKPSSSRLNPSCLASSHDRSQRPVRSHHW